MGTPPPQPPQPQHGLGVCIWMHLVSGTGNSPSPGQPTPGVVKQDKSSRGSVDTTKTRSDPQRVRMSSGERPIGAAKGKQSGTEALRLPPPPPQRGDKAPLPPFSLGIRACMHVCMHVGMRMHVQCMHTHMGMEMRAPPGSSCMPTVSSLWGGSGMHWKGGRYPPPHPRGPSLCSATVPLTPGASFNGICNRR